MMECTTEVKKIAIDPKTMAPTLTVEFVLDKYSEIDKFQSALTDFEHKLQGQKKL